ncbi:MAG: BamA/TamA family outer membrane protein [Myxococcales bacterium]|nr:BamA/TamA family outer membrane protein [Myxococcales bacterium]
MSLTNAFGIGVVAAVLVFFASLEQAWTAPKADVLPTADQVDDFGPRIVIEAVEITGNSSTDSEVILNVLSLKAGDSMRAGSAKLEAARYSVLSLGFFRKVELSMAKGSERGKVILLIDVEERGTIVLNRLFFGNSIVTPWWAGLDLTERNFLGTGIGVGGAFVVAEEGDAGGSRSQRSIEVRVLDQALLSSRFGWQLAGYALEASEPYRHGGEPDDGSIENFSAFDYERVGARGTLSSGGGALSRVYLGGRLERIRADLPANPMRVLPDGSLGPIDLQLEDGTSHLVSVSAAYDRDTRIDPVLPFDGDRLLLHSEAASDIIAGSYQYLSIRAKYQRWWQVSGNIHVVSAHFSGGLVLGGAPLFERIHVGDLNRMVSGRALGLVTSATPSLDLLDLSTDELVYGEVGGLAEAQYSYKLFRSSNWIYGGELFVGLGLWTLATTADVSPRESPPIDLLVDAGLRLDTEIGIFELSLANALGRLPL